VPGEGAVAARDEQPIGSVRVATVEDMAVDVLPPMIATFREKHPHVTVVVDVRQSVVDLARHEADIALRFGSKPSADLLLVIHVDMRKNARVRAFVEHVYAALAAQRPLFEDGA
jgi:DNA-binding transcriptional LysR family regulator